MDDKDIDHPLTKFSADSSWSLGGVSDAAYFFQSYIDGTTHSDLDWNLHAHTMDPTHHQIESDFAANTSLGIAISGNEPPVLPQPAVSSSSSEDRPEKSTVSAEKPLSETASKVKKKGQKRIRQQRYAFVTKSDVDHLEDGYRWRKYGQKAVKNSPFPRSYYRCTNSKCTVKKRVERSYEDPTTVITTYEGQHCHHTVGFSRGGLIGIHGSAFPSPLIHSPSQYYYPRAQFPQEGSLSITQSPQVSVNAGESHVQTETNPQISLDEGLLGDMVPPGIRNR